MKPKEALKKTKFILGIGLPESGGSGVSFQELGIPTFSDAILTIASADELIR